MKAEHLSGALEQLELLGKNVVVHSSLRSFGYIEGGAEAIVSTLKHNLANVLMPAFSTDAVVKPPINDRPRRNGCNYADTAYWSLNSPSCFNINTQGVDRRIGRVAQAFAASDGVVRSPHPWHSWAAFGPAATAVVRTHEWMLPHQPLQRFSETQAYILLLGVDLRSCTAVHLAEEQIGRKPFIRWARDFDGTIKRIAVAGCAAGFNNLLQPCQDLFSRYSLEMCQIMVAPLDVLVKRCVSLISSNPEITRCSAECLRCTDAILGGPED